MLISFKFDKPTKDDFDNWSVEVSNEKGIMTLDQKVLGKTLGLELKNFFWGLAEVGFSRTSHGIKTKVTLPFLFEDEEVCGKVFLINGDDEIIFIMVCDERYDLFDSLNDQTPVLKSCAITFRVQINKSRQIIDFSKMEKPVFLADFNVLLDNKHATVKREASIKECCVYTLEACDQLKVRSKAEVANSDFLNYLYNEYKERVVCDNQPLALKLDNYKQQVIIYPFKLSGLSAFAVFSVQSTNRIRMMETMSNALSRMAVEEFEL